MIYTIILIGIIALSLSLKGVEENRRTSVFCFGCFFILSAVSAVRYQAEYSDYLVNYMRVIQASSQTWAEVFGYSSVLHQIFRKLVAAIFGDPQWYFALSAFFVVGMNIRAVKRYGYYTLLCVLLYYAEFGYFTSNTITRQAIAAAITMCSWRYIFSREPLKYCAVMVLAMLNHISAVFFFPIYFMAKIRFSRKIMLPYAAAGTVVVVFNRPIIALLQRVIFSDYTENSYGMKAANSLRLVLAVLCAVMIVIMTVRKEKQQREEQLSRQQILHRTQDIYDIYDNFILNGTFVYIICTIISSVSILLFSRIALYFAPCAILCIDNAIARISNKQTRRLVYAGVLLFVLAWFSAMNYMGKYTPTPYTVFWDFPNRLRIA